jgi:glycosyltransferase involved in cell wall biosynthesis
LVGETDTNIGDEVRVNLGFHYHIPAICKGKEIYMPGYLGRFLDALAEHCDRLVCFLHGPQASEALNMDYRIQSSNVELVSIGPHMSVPRRTLQAWKYVLPQVRRYRHELDAMLLRGPSPLLPLVAWAVGPVPTVLLVVGDYLFGPKDTLGPGWRRWAISLWARWNRWAQDRVAMRSLTFVNSRKLYEEFRPFVANLWETRTTTLVDGDFFVRDDTCIRRPYHLLYVGRLTRSKGILDLVEALGILVDRGEDVVLDLVGWFDEDFRPEELMVAATARGVSERILLHGYKPVGPELFSFYRRADIFVLGSVSESFPRAIWEAMANSLPVVATDVGSIRDFVAEAASIVPPARPEQLANAIFDIFQNSSRRQELIRKGRELARENTLERQVTKMVSIIRSKIHNENE